MSEIEKMKRHIERTHMSEKQRNNYAINNLEICALFAVMQEDWFDAICTAYNYGRSKGYRAAKAEVRA